MCLCDDRTWIEYNSLSILHELFSVLPRAHHTTKRLQLFDRHDRVLETTPCQLLSYIAVQTTT